MAERVFSLNGPSVVADPRSTPVRGDLAHIKLAGRCFVPHYAVPMLYRGATGATLVSHPSADAEVIAELPEGAVFEVLDIAGHWSWGQIENDGFVGYIANENLEAVT